VVEQRIYLQLTGKILLKSDFNLGLLLEDDGKNLEPTARKTIDRNILSFSRFFKSSKQIVARQKFLVKVLNSHLVRNNEVSMTSATRR